MKEKPQKAYLSTLIDSSVERRLEELQTHLRRKGARRNPTAKAHLIELLIQMPEAEKYLEGQILV